MIKSNRSLLTTEERTICEQISVTEQGLYAQRARALLALDEGLTQARACELAGLTDTQISQCLEAFRQLRTAGIYSAQTDLPTTQTVPEFSSQLDVTDSNIENSVTHLKQTLFELKRNRAAAGPVPGIQAKTEIQVKDEPAGADDKVKASDPQPARAPEISDESDPAAKPEKKKKKDSKAKTKKPRKKPKKPKKQKHRKPKKRKRKKKQKK